jgi:V/A-type H+-transporting ATPase subunit E
MSYQKLFKVLENQIDSEANEIITAAQKKADVIIRSARQKVEAMNKQLLEESNKKEDFAKSDKQVSAKKYKLSKLLLPVKNENFQQVIDTTRKKLNNLPQQAEYSRVLKKLIREVTTSLPECAAINVNPRDVALAQKILKELQLKLEVKTSHKVSSGVIASSADGRLSVCNTIDSRLEKLIPHISPQVVGILYG